MCVCVCVYLGAFECVLTAEHVEQHRGGVEVGRTARVVAGVLAPRVVDHEVAHLQRARTSHCLPDLQYLNPVKKCLILYGNFRHIPVGRLSKKAMYIV